MPSGVFPTIFFGSLPGGASDGSPAELGGGRASQPLQPRAVTSGGRAVRPGALAELGGRACPVVITRPGPTNSFIVMASGTYEWDFRRSRA